MSSLLTNSESWNLLKSEETELDKIEIMSLKNLFDLPTRTPTPAILITLGTMYASIRVDQKQLLYLHKLLTKNENQWTLFALRDLDIGWYARIRKKLQSYQLNDNFDQIKNIPYISWKQQVRKVTEKQNKDRLINECYKIDNGTSRPKTKTATILQEIEKENYQRKTTEVIKNCTKNESKVLIMSRFGMLECGRNMKGTINETCSICKVSDDEEHRLNYCVKFRESNFYNDAVKTPFRMVYSKDKTVLLNIFEKIAQVWNVNQGYGSMN